VLIEVEEEIEYLLQDFHLLPGVAARGYPIPGRISTRQVRVSR
jgi:hypothetical protein